MEKKWEELTPEEKQEELFNQWLSPKDPQGKDLKFQSPQAEKLYKERTTRIKDAIQLKKKPDRVPVLLIPSFAPAFYSGLTPYDVMYNYDKIAPAWKKFSLDFQPDSHGGCAVPSPGKFLETLDFKLYKWPGHGVSNKTTYQAIEGDYMKADEYDILINNPLYFFYYIWPSRVFGALEPIATLPHLSCLTEMYGVSVPFFHYGTPPVKAAYQALLESGDEALKWIQVVGGFDQEMPALGFPAHQAGPTKAPFDVIGDTLRGTKGIMLDMYRQPDKLLQAMEVLTPMFIQLGVDAAKMAGNPLIVMPLHKGADGFLSDAQFKKFYWPTLRKVIMGLVDEGCVPFIWAEGGYNSRLEVIQDLPKGKTAWLFDQTDMAKAKEALDGIACVAGNMPMDLLAVGTTQDAIAHTKRLIDICGKGGGYIMANGAFFDEVKWENLKAIVDTVKEYGVYKR
ncbi:MAG: uroporphyrinogen decarboxylase [Deltaproteobacteria bacterium]|nr:uroporphyrinogen decarboxylase [Deltaproteobacteria bacterium]